MGVMCNCIGKESSNRKYSDVPHITYIHVQKAMAEFLSESWNHEEYHLN
jgi:hypothetical protein